MVIPIDTPSKITNIKENTSQKIEKIEKTNTFSDLLDDKTPNKKLKGTEVIKDSISKITKKPSDFIKLETTIKNLKQTNEDTTQGFENIDNFENQEIKGEVLSFKQAQEEFKNIINQGNKDTKNNLKQMPTEDKMFVIKFKNFKSIEINIKEVKIVNIEDIKNKKEPSSDIVQKEVSKISVTNNFILSKLNKSEVSISSPNTKEKKIKKVNSDLETIKAKNNNNTINHTEIKKSSYVELLNNKEHSNVSNNNKQQKFINKDKVDNINIQNINLESSIYKKQDDKVILMQLNKNELKNKIEDNITKIVEHKMNLPLTNIKIKLNNNETIHLKFSGTKDKANLDIKTSDTEIAKEISKVKETLSSNIENNSNIKQVDISIVLDKKETIEKYLYMINKNERDKDDKQEQHKQRQSLLEIDEEEEIND
jgi:hypothetical protein